MRRIVIATLVLSCLGGAALAHAKLKAAVPAAGATVKTGFTDLALTFNEPVEPALSVVEVDDAKGQVLLSSKGTPVCADTVCRLTLPPLAAGDYRVVYHVLSVDGHVVKGDYDFHVAD